MGQIRAEASAIIEAPPQKVYAILADYRNGHPQILPKPYFLSLEVEQGGVWAGTIIRFQMRTFGTTRTFRAEIKEPEPGRVMTETDLKTGAVTTFTVEPVDDDRRASVTITTVWESRGIGGMMERWLAPPMLQRIHREELGNLARCAEETSSHPPRPN